MLHLLRAAAVLLPVIALAPAHATCTQADAAGTWASYTVGLGASADYWMHCTLRIDAAGNFAAATSSCVASSGLMSPAHGTFHLLNGNLCAFKGGITLSKGTAENFISHATLSPDKGTAEGVGLFESGGFSFNLVKIK